MLSSDCSQIGTGSSNSPRSTIQSLRVSGLSDNRSKSARLRAIWDQKYGRGERLQRRQSGEYADVVAHQVGSLSRSASESLSWEILRSNHRNGPRLRFIRFQRGLSIVPFPWPPRQFVLRHKRSIPRPRLPARTRPPGPTGVSARARPRRANLVRPSAARTPHRWRPPASRSVPRPSAPRLPQASPRPLSIDAFPYFTHSEQV
jgi:hypothetical protein